MAVSYSSLIYFLSLFQLIICAYPPTGEEVQQGSVLLPATRRGRYLANIIRRQAVDGTGIKFNKDADRMNAEAKKKVDVLSDELLPYIIAEQERRTTLYKRIMTAIQNGEKGVTIAEIRNKPPLIIRKGLMYRCPVNRSPKEPDGSGVIMCEDEIEPTPVMYDSCLSAEDKELYVAENKYFFCNRHKVEGPDLPRNGSTVIGCAPLERTSLNYTSGKCALEDTDDVVVHYRYYPDRTYKFVTELDPDREVCDHWNPCQIGYIYSLPSPDQAMPANELWRDYEERPDLYEKDEIVPPIPDDNKNENVPVHVPYETSNRRVVIPEGYKFSGIGKVNQYGSRVRLTVKGKNVLKNMTHFKVEFKETGDSIRFSVNFDPFLPSDEGLYYIRLENKKKPGDFKFIDNVLTISPATTISKILALEAVPSQELNRSVIPLKCSKCVLMGMMLRGEDGVISNVDNVKYRVKSANDGQKYIEFTLGETRAEDFGDYFAVIQGEDGTEERVKVLSLKKSTLVKVSTGTDSMEIGSHFDKTVTYTCTDCSVDDIFCNGQSVLRSGRITLQPAAKTININYPSFEDEHACVYVGVFKINNESYKKNIFILENSFVKITKLDTVPSPGDSQPFKKEIPYKCTGECSIDKVTVDGVDIPHTPTRRSGNGAYYDFTDTKITIIIPNFSFLYRGAYQCIWNTAVGRVTKLIMVISEPGEAGGDAGGGDAGGGDGGDATTAASDGEAAKSGSEAGSEGESTTAASGAEGGGGEAGDASSEAPAEGGETSAPAESEAPPA